MNNIDILEEFIEAYRMAEEVLDGEVIDAIETLIAENKELKERNKRQQSKVEEELEDIKTNYFKANYDINEVIDILQELLDERNNTDE